MLDTPLSIPLRLKSAANRLTWTVRRRLRWGRRRYVERPAMTLSEVTAAQHATIADLRTRHGVAFEAAFAAVNALENYSLLQILDRARQRFGWRPPPGQRLVDIGSKNFFYATVLQLIFRPSHLVGIELDGYRLYDDLHTRWSYAQHYLRDLPATEYRVMNFLDYRGTADGCCCFYPFVIPEPLVHWHLPLHEFRPRALFAHARACLAPNGWLLMINQNAEEWTAAHTHASSAGLRLAHHFTNHDALIPRPNIPVVSLWERT